MKNQNATITWLPARLKFSLLIFLCGFIHTAAQAETLSPDTLSKGTFILHKFQQAIGKEKYSIIQKGDSLKLQSNFKFNDRGQDVPLQTTLTLNKSGLPVYFKIKGKTSRSSVVDSEVVISNDSASIRVNEQLRKITIRKSYFTISGYSPVSVQMLLIKYWKENNKPESLHVYPNGDLKIKLDGYDTITQGNDKRILERYFIKGLIWGSETIWTDTSGKLVALFTNDAEGDKFEAIEESYLNSLPILIGKAASYGMKNLKVSQIEKDNPLIALTNGNIIDVITGNIARNHTIIIKDGIILKIGSTEKTKIPKGAKVINLSGKSVLPGLWDMHAHFQQVEWGPAYLAAGVTTVRDCGNEFDFINSVKQAIDKQNGIGPRIIKAGIIDGDSPYALGIIRVNTESEAATVVKKYKDSGYDQIKIYSSVKPEMIKAIATEAHKVGLPVTGHIPQGVGLLDAIKLGQNQVNHFTFIMRAMLTSPGQKKIVLTDSTSQKILRALKDNNIVVDPTLGIYEWILRPLDQPLDAFEPGVNSVTEDLKEIFRNTGLPPEVAKERKFVLENGKEIVLAMHKMGIPIVAGTDMMVPGYSLYREIELYKEAGLTSLEAIQTATINPARVMKKENETGSVQEGKKADIIIIDGNPLESISHIRNVILVIKDGKIYDPSALRKIIDFKP